MGLCSLLNGLPEKIMDIFLDIYCIPDYKSNM